jgi:hypothetical protein
MDTNNRGIGPLDVSGSTSNDGYFAKYRLEALVCEPNAKDATDPALKKGWAEIAIDWHALSSRASEYNWEF